MFTHTHRSQKSQKKISIFIKEVAHIIDVYLYLSCIYIYAHSHTFAIIIVELQS
jgi:hypothetical protein